MDKLFRPCTAIIFSALAFFTQTETIASDVIASYAPINNASSFFGVGASVTTRRAQTFTAARSGYVRTVSFAANRSESTTAPLRITITDTLDGGPNEPLAEAYVDPSKMPLSFIWKPALVATADFLPARIYLEEGTMYGLVVDAAEPVAGYTLWGTSVLPYTAGTRYDWSGGWDVNNSGDFLFQVMAVPDSAPPIIDTLTLTNQQVELTWINGLGATWIDQSTNLRDWTVLDGPFTNIHTWTGKVDDADQKYFRIRSDF